MAAQFRYRVDVVTLDATVVNDRDEPATDVTASDFAVTVDARPWWSGAPAAFIGSLDSTSQIAVSRS